MRTLRISAILGVLLLCLGILGRAEDAGRVSSNAGLLSRSHFADYDAELRLPNGRVDTDRLVARL